MSKLLLFIAIILGFQVNAQRFTCDTFEVNLEVKDYTCSIKGYVSASGINPEIAPYTYQLTDTGIPQTSGAFINLDPLQDSIYITDRRGCKGIFPIHVQDQCGQNGISVNNSLTPNNDGIDDYWKISGWENYPDIEIFVFNNFGQRVFHATDYYQPWDGSFLGMPEPESTYFYVIKLDRFSSDIKKTVHGSLTLIR